MNDSNQNNFLELNIVESGNKFSTLVFNGAEIKFWIPEQESFVASAIKNSLSKTATDFVVKFKSMLDFSKWKGQRVLFSFNMTGMIFFGECQFHNWSDDNTFEIIISKGIYRYEKRRSERLLAYPGYRFYAHFNLAMSGNVTNISFIHRPDKNIEDTFSNYLDKTGILDDNGDRLSKLRILDLSEHGLSVVANEKEMHSFERNEMNVVIEIYGNMYHMKIENVYSVDYVDPRIANVRMYKLGFNFTNTDEKYISRIRSLIGNVMEIERPELIFEDFIK